MKFRWCVVPKCGNSTFKTPEKLFIQIPNEIDTRNVWLRVSGRDPMSLSTKPRIHLCEDHFDLEQDMENYMQFKIMGSVSEIRMKPNTMPSKFSHTRIIPSKFSHTPIVSPSQAARSTSTTVHPGSSTLYSKDENISPKEQKADKQVHVPVMHYKSIQANLSPHYRSKATQHCVKIRHCMTSPIKSSTVSVATSPHIQITANNIPSRSDSGGREQDPPSQVVQQCRFCGKFSKDCVAVSSDMTYLAGNKTTLALNDTSVQLDFNDGSLPKTVCRDCDAKLQEFCDFVKVVKAAQCTLINVAEEKEWFGTRAEYEGTTADVEEKTEHEETETVMVKMEYDSQQEDSDGDDDKEGILDYLSVGETVYAKETHKKNSNTDTAKPKKLKAKEKCEDDLVIDIKEEVVEENANDGYGVSEVSDTGTDVKPSGGELELTTSALVFEMAGDGASEYQGYQSHR